MLLCENLAKFKYYTVLTVSKVITIIKNHQIPRNNETKINVFVFMSFFVEVAVVDLLYFVKCKRDALYMCIECKIIFDAAQIAFQLIIF